MLNPKQIQSREIAFAFATKMITNIKKELHIERSQNISVLTIKKGLADYIVYRLNNSPNTPLCDILNDMKKSNYEMLEKSKTISPVVASSAAKCDSVFKDFAKNLQNELAKERIILSSIGQIINS